MADPMETIITNLATALGLIKKTAYRNDIGDVIDDVVVSEGLDYPAIFISTPKADFSDLGSNYADVDEQINIYCIVKADKPQAALRSIRADVLQAIEADPTLGGACQRLRILGSANAADIMHGGAGSPPGFDLATGCAYLRIECGVTYQAYKPSGI